jgi:predicted lipoprotein with Yx(FWY)xxD motif
MRHLLKLSLPAIAASLLIAACGSSSSGNTTSSAAGTQPAAQTSSSGGSSSAVLVKSASNSLGTILVDSQGMTLYHLSGEQNGKFICTSTACLGAWHPLLAPSSGAPSGEVGSLGSVKRPEGTMQVTYKGTPLYTFTGDQQSGETKGQGIKDVGTWNIITTNPNPNTTPTTTSTSSTPPATPAPSTGSPSKEPSNSSGGYDGYVVPGYVGQFV